MNILLIILSVLLLIKSNSIGDVLDVVKNVDFSALSDYLKGFGINEALIDVISSENFKNFITQKDIKHLMPLLPTVISLLNTKPSVKATNDIISEDYLNPIKNIGGEEISFYFNDYFT